MIVSARVRQAWGSAKSQDTSGLTLFLEAEAATRLRLRIARAKGRQGPTVELDAIGIAHLMRCLAEALTCTLLGCSLTGTDEAHEG